MILLTNPPKLLLNMTPGNRESQAGEGEGSRGGSRRFWSLGVGSATVSRRPHFPT